ncbi:hypothetical protein BY458DRAFT_511250 [Sporodiniella umbellata]|nr:hypothetical protein BY458DRAFT_511250 [Sporodiniella umbellata]
MKACLIKNDSHIGCGHYHCQHKPLLRKACIQFVFILCFVVLVTVIEHIVPLCVILYTLL